MSLYSGLNGYGCFTGMMTCATTTTSAAFTWHSCGTALSSLGSSGRLPILIWMLTSPKASKRYGYGKKIALPCCYALHLADPLVQSHASERWAKDVVRHEHCSVTAVPSAAHLCTIRLAKDNANCNLFCITVLW